MSIFGDMDLSDVSDDPDAIESGTYHCVLTRTSIVDNPKDHKAVTLGWQIDEPTNEYHKDYLNQFLPFPDIKAAGGVDNLEPEQKKQLKRLKKVMRRGFDMTDTQFNKLSEDVLAELKSSEAYLDVKYNAPFKNVNDVKSPRLYKEENGDSDESADDLGVDF